MVELSRSQGLWLPAIVRIVRGDEYMLESTADSHEMIIAQMSNLRPWVAKISIKSDDFEVHELKVSDNFNLLSYLNS
jgi:hypothetical protein